MTTTAEKCNYLKLLRQLNGFMIFECLYYFRAKPMGAIIRGCFSETYIALL